MIVCVYSQQKFGGTKAVLCKYGTNKMDVSINIELETK